MRILALPALVLAAALAGPTAQAAPPPGGWGGHGGHGGAGYGYGYGHGYYGGWHNGYPGYGYGIGLGLGYGSALAWSVASPWYWGGAYGYGYGAPALYPYGYAGYPAVVLNEGVTYVQQAQVEAAPPPPPTRQATSSWYYCTEPAGYFPYVQQCARPWVAVQPQAVPPVGSAPSH